MHIMGGEVYSEPTHSSPISVSSNTKQSCICKAFFDRHKYDRIPNKGSQLKRCITLDSVCFIIQYSVMKK
jgi:hypothetical protein